MAVLVFIVAFPILVDLFGSLRKTLEFMLIFSFSIVMVFKIGNGDENGDPNLGIPITFSMLLVIALFAVWTWRISKGKDKVYLFRPVIILFSILVVWAIFSSTWAANPGNSVYRFFGIFEMLFILIYSSNMIKTKNDIHFIVKCIAFTVAVSGVVGIIQYFTQSTFGLVFLGEAGSKQLEWYKMYTNIGIYRVTGFQLNSNSFAWFLKLWLPLLLLWALVRPSNKCRYICLFSFILGSIALVLTFSRGGWLAFIFSLLIAFVLYLKLKNRHRFKTVIPRFLILGSAALLLLLFLIPKITKRWTSDDYAAIFSRFPGMKVAINIIQNNPFRGLGLGNYAYSMQEYDITLEKTTIIFPHPVHNVYLHIAAELGLFGLAIFLCLAAIIFYYGLKTLKSRDPVIILLGICLVAGIAGFCLHSMWEPGVFGWWKFRPFWFMSGLVFSCYKLKENKWN
jgi:O-antigen ligase